MRFSDTRQEKNPLAPYIELEREYIRKKQKRAEERNKRKKRFNEQIIVTDRKSCEEYWETIGKHLNKKGRVKLLAEKDLIEVKENELR